MKLPIDFERQAKLKNITWWKSHECSICGAPVGTEIVNGQASYRSACGCAWSPNHSYGWDHVAERYNIQNNPDVIARMNEFWGFTD